LDYLHRICKIIHTDLKPENTIVALNDEELGDIVKNGMNDVQVQFDSNRMADEYYQILYK
jgi:starch phosphorylase